MARSLRASITGVKKAEAAFKRSGRSQDYIAGACSCTRQVVGNFLARRSVRSDLFQAICAELGLEWCEIAEAEEGTQVSNRPSNLDELVATVREVIRERIQKQYGTMRVLDMSKPIGLNDIYTNVNILEKVTARRRLEVAELLKLNHVNTQDFERFSLGDIVEKRIPGTEAVEKHERLLILGKPGAGKTTFLKYLTIQCISGNWYVDQIPAFVTLKDFAEEPGQPSILNYLQQLFKSYGLASDLTMKRGLVQSLLAWNETSVEQLLKGGRILVLLDGLDEVRASDAGRVLKQLRDFADQFTHSQILMTCRIAAREYTFDKFTEVEIADFDDDQIATFSQKWFQAKDDFVKADRFAEKLKENSRIRELATNPLLLTLLCTTFEESGNFPQNRAELYQEGLDVLLKKWDIKRNIEREQIYKQLSLQRKEDLLSFLALNTFERGDYFFKQTAVEQQIGNYIRNLPGANTTEDDLQLDSEAILKSIEAQHGLLVERAWKIYSFSHLTFHEFFTARAISLSRQPQQQFHQLVQHMSEKRWREVFLLTVGLLSEADELLLKMKAAADQILPKDDKKLQEFLSWINHKPSSINAPYKPASIRTFYLDLVLDRNLNRSHSYHLVRNTLRVNVHGHDRIIDLGYTKSNDFDLDRDLVIEIVHDLIINCDLNLDPNLVIDIVHELVIDRSLTLALALARDIDININHDTEINNILALVLVLALAPELKRELQQLKDKISQSKDWESKNRWWNANGKTWIEQLRSAMLKYRNIGYSWQFTSEQKELLQQYYDANKLLLDCLNSDCYVSRKVRAQIEATLLLPVNPEERDTQ